MTDKEIKTNILAEIERLLTELTSAGEENVSIFEEGRISAFEDMKLFIDSLPEEPVPTPNEKMDTKRWKEACKAACCDANYRSHYGLTETRDDYFVDGVQWADEHPIKEPVSDDLEEASIMHYKDVMEYEAKTGLKPAYMTSFKAGAKWDREKIINKVVEWLKENVHKYADSFVDSFELCKDLKQILGED